MVINIGEKVKARAEELKMGPTELGRLINTSKQNVNGIYKRKSLDTETLEKLSIALKYNFFSLYKMHEKLYTTADIPLEYEKNHQKLVPYKDYLKLKSDYDNLQEKYDLLKKINELLERKKKP